MIFLIWASDFILSGLQFKNKFKALPNLGAKEY